MGTEAFETGMKHYFETWKFKHPYPDDFKKALESSSHISLDEVFKLLLK
jgi:aminopeptidase N